MNDLKDFLKELVSLPGLSGYETPVRDVIRKRWEPWCDEMTVTPLGSLHGLKKGTGPEPRPRILLAAHMDAIGLIVTRLSKDGLIFFTQVGGVDPRILPSTPVIVHARRDLPGIVGQLSDKLVHPSVAGKPHSLEDLVVDVGLEAEEVHALVRVGDIISFATEPIEMPDDLLIGHTMDNRASVAALTACMEELATLKHSWDVFAVATVQEETRLAGGFTSPFIIRPQIAVAMDVTFAKGPGANDYRARTLGECTVICQGPNTHPWVYNRFEEIAEQLDIPYESEPYTSYSGTDAMGMQIVAEGIPSMVLSIPLRYMHTPVEMISMKDVRRTGRLMAQFIASLQPETAAEIRWDEEDQE